MAETNNKKEVVDNSNKSIYALLQEARYELSKCDLKKSGFNKFANYKYFELGDFLPETIRILKEKGLSTHFILDIDNMGQEIAVMKVIKSNSGEHISFKIPTAEATSNSPIMGLGSKITYLRRYLFLLVMDISENDSEDAIEHSNKKTMFATKNQIATITKGAKYVKEELENLEMKSPKDLSKLPMDKASELCSLIVKRAEEEKNTAGTVENEKNEEVTNG